MAPTSTGGPGSDQLPDITAAWRGGSADAGGAYEFAVVARELGVKADTTGDGDLDIDETENGTGFMAAGGWQVGDAYIYAHYNFGDGIGRYIINGFQNDLYVDANGNVDTVESSGGNIGVTFDVADQDKINLVYGFFENDSPDESNGIDNLTSLHLAYWNNRAGGLAFGPILGPLYASIGAGMGGTVGFWIARKMGHDYVKSKLKFGSETLETTRFNFSVIFLLSLIPVMPVTVIVAVAVSVPPLPSEAS